MAQGEPRLSLLICVLLGQNGAWYHIIYRYNNFILRGGDEMEIRKQYGAQRYGESDDSMTTQVKDIDDLIFAGEPVKLHSEK